MATSSPLTLLSGGGAQKSLRVFIKDVLRILPRKGHVFTYVGSTKHLRDSTKYLISEPSTTEL
jgi:predicted methyltransferase